ncbi:GNAT family N-acetyltransferase [Iningainema tapete]|uniref:GNAT family N-acetyltransferase n=1 Tax=Iningainema tapete BLCC-T55 TaxID=2748662 RepID=A0A8J7BYR3_9CYAN|nr:GNAT family N-acetyltransferase [Iningainema tapete]MBD2776207.1 GNAT family N-acetyltransferase [Iningainema tapete BLCC-T55]
MKQYSLMRSFSEPGLSSRLFNLLEIVFAEIGITGAAECARRLGAAWEEASTPFMRFQDGMLVSHVGVVEIPLQLMGERVTVAGVHAVCTHPDFRRRGYYREVMTQVLDYCDERYKAQLLTTSQPELYEPFGFRVVKEHIFTTSCDSKGGGNGFRLLDFTDALDVRKLHRLLETRESVSDILGVLNEKAVFCVNEGRNPLYYAPDLDVMVVMEVEDSKLKLFDLVGTKICTLKDILARIPQPIIEVEIYFCGDRLDVDAQALPHILDGDSLLMVRGEFVPFGQKFMLPRSTRC